MDGQASDANDINLLFGIAQKREDAFRTIYEKYSRKVYSFAYTILQESSLAEEVMQETMLKLWLMGESVTKIENLNAYLRITSRNICYNLLKRQQMEQKIKNTIFQDWNEASSDMEDTIIYKDSKSLLDRAIAALPYYCKRVYILCYQDGLSYKEAAEELNISPHSVKTYMKRALSSIRKYLNARTILFIFWFFK